MHKMTTQKTASSFLLASIALISISILFQQATHAKSADLKPKSQSAPPETGHVPGKGDVRKIAFPKDFSLGKLYLLPKVQYGFINEIQPFGSARGKVEVTVPPDYELFLSASGEVIRHPELFDSLPVDALDGIKVSALNLGEDIPSMTDQVLAHVARLTGVKRVILSRSDVTDKGLMQLAPLVNLKSIDVAMTAAEGTFLKTIANFKNIEYFSASESALKEANLQYIRNWTKLREFDARRTHLTNHSLQYIKQCQQLQGIDLGQNEGIDDSAIKDLNQFRHLIFLGIDQTHITAKGLGELKPSALHTMITICDTNFTKQEAHELSIKLKPMTIMLKTKHIVPDKDMARIFSPLR